MVVLHPQQFAFLEAIRDRPDDDAPRLVYADWLEEHGDPARAEFIRAQCAAERLDPNDPRRGPLEDRAAALEQAHAPEWLGTLNESVDRSLSRGEKSSWRFRRGFLYRVRLRPRWPGFLRAAGDLLACEPIEELVLVASKQPLERLLAEVAAAPLDCLRSLSWCYSAPLRPEGVELLASSPRLPRLTALAPYGPVPVETLRALASPPLGGRLTSLQLEANPGEGAEVLAVLTRAPGLPSLRSVDLKGCPPTDDGLRRLASCAPLGRLSELSVCAVDDLTARGMAHLVKSPLWGRLTRLALYHCPIDDAGARTLIQALPRSALRKLTLTNCRLTEATVSALVAAPSWGALENLYLSDPLGDAAVVALAGSPHLANLRALALPNCGLGVEGARALATSPYGERLLRLVVSELPLPRGARAVLTRRFGKRLWDGP
jgi:uncharacterized protein (TIGR02996 family)